MHHLLCLRWKPADITGKRRSDAMAATLVMSGGWVEIINWRGARVFLRADANDLAPLLLPKETGVILGAVFREGRPLGTADIDIETVGAWCLDDCASFVRDLWGPYLALITDHRHDRVLILRDPGAARPCFVAAPDDAGVSVVFTHLEDLAAVRPLGEIDRSYLSMFLAHPRLVTRRTGLADVREVLAGECVALGRDADDTWMAWSPPAANAALASESADALAASLRAVIEQTVKAYACLGRPIVHRLSGGLDSSVALSALIAARADVRCVSERPLGVEEGDESSAAAEVAEALGVTLRLVDYRARDIDYSRLLTECAAAKPALSLLTFADRHFISALDATGDTLMTSGQGGDQVFFRASAIAAMADAVRDGCAPSHLVEIALDIARVTRRSVWAAFASGIEYGVFKSSEAYLRTLLETATPAGTDADVAGAIAEALAHPWRSASHEAGPAQMARTLFLADLQYYHTPSSLNAAFVSAPVLASQPIMSFCARLPAYVTMRGGSDRALVRLGFRDVLPAVALARRRKGDTTRYFAAVAAQNAPFMRDMLRGGELEGLRLRRQHAAVDVDDISTEFIAEMWLRQLKALRAAQQSERQCASGA